MNWKGYFILGHSVHNPAENFKSLKATWSYFSFAKQKEEKEPNFLCIPVSLKDSQWIIMKSLP